MTPECHSLSDMARSSLNALVIEQWRDAWDGFPWDAPGGKQPRPNSRFLTFTMSAAALRALSGVYRRNPSEIRKRTEDESVQRPHNDDRSREIRRFVDYGYPISEMRGNPEGQDVNLRRPGWLPTAVVVNILSSGQERDGMPPLSAADQLEVPDLESELPGSVSQLLLPEDWSLGKWRPSGTPPIEVIDGQHRLWAFEADEDMEDFYLPVVAFVDLPRSYQAYLFWTINIKPKKINTSLAFDLYPMLRSQDWLMKGEGIRVYRESRSQELAEAMWATPSSPWFDRINMIGAVGVRPMQPVTQNSFVRSLVNTFVRSWTGGRSGLVGGLFGSTDEGGLGWTRAQQAAFLVASWRHLYDTIVEIEPIWFQALPVNDNDETPGVREGERDPFGRFSMLGSDQGVRAFSAVLNDVFYEISTKARLGDWREVPSGDVVDPVDVENSLVQLRNMHFFANLQAFGASVAEFDWRSAAEPSLSEQEVLERAAYKGSGGYVALRRDLLRHLGASKDEVLREASSTLIGRLEKTREN